MTFRALALNWGVTAAWERAKELRPRLTQGGDPLATRGARRRRRASLIDRALTVEVHFADFGPLGAAISGPCWKVHCPRLRQHAGDRGLAM